MGLNQGVKKALHGVLRNPFGPRGHNARHHEEAAAQDAFVGESSSERERSRRRRKIVEEFPGWLKTVDGLRRSRGITGHTGWWKIAQQVALAAAA